VMSVSMRDMYRYGFQMPTEEEGKSPHGVRFAHLYTEVCVCDAY
jgi:hypothetical protein